MKPVTIAEIIVALLIAVGIITWLIRRNVKDERNTNPELTDAIKDDSAAEIHEEDYDTDAADGNKPPSDTEK